MSPVPFSTTQMAQSYGAQSTGGCSANRTHLPAGLGDSGPTPALLGDAWGHQPAQVVGNYLPSFRQDAIFLQAFFFFGRRDVVTLYKATLFASRFVFGCPLP